MRPLQHAELRRLMLLLKGTLGLLIFGISVFGRIDSSRTFAENSIVNVFFIADKQYTTDGAATIIQADFTAGSLFGNLQNTRGDCTLSLIDGAKGGISINNSTSPTTTFLLKTTYQNKQSLTEGNTC